jgi:DNA-binding transcriptional LysR family regulator
VSLTANGKPRAPQFLASVELRELRAFLTVAEELHFGRAAERLGITPSYVSQTIRTLEARLGGKLFDRTSRRVTLTVLGERFRQQLEPAYAAVQLAVQTTHLEAGVSAGRLRVGFTGTTEGPVLSDLIKRFQARHPSCEVTLHETEIFDPYRALRCGEVDLLYNYLPIGEPDLVAGPVLARYEVRLAVAREHRLAGESAVWIEDLADEETARVPSSFPAALHDRALPPCTPSGRPIRRTHPVRTIKEIISLVAQGRIVWPVAGPTVGADREDIVTVPMRDVPALPVGLIWRREREGAHVRALSDTAHALTRDRGAPNDTRKQIRNADLGALQPT